MPTITIPAGSVQFVPADNGGIYVNAVSGRSIKAKIRLEDGTERDVSLRTVVIHAPTNQNTALAGADKAQKAGQSKEVQSLAAKVDTLASQFSQLMAVLAPQPAPAAALPVATGRKTRK